MVSNYSFIISFSHPPAPPNDGVHFTSLFKLPPPALHQTMLSMKLLYLNSPPPRAPPINALHEASLFKLYPPFAPPYDGLHFTSLFKLPPPALHHTMVSN